MVWCGVCVCVCVCVVNEASGMQEQEETCVYYTITLNPLSEALAKTTCTVTYVLVSAGPGATASQLVYVRWSVNYPTNFPCGKLQAFRSH